ncbi:MAG: manganese catalase family protein [Caloramator sp.]|nr:manganese catalase family protein [Caloramator sp.]
MENCKDLEALKEIEERVEKFLKSLPCQSKLPMPEIKVEKENLEYAKLLLNAFSGSEDSELAAILQYLYHHETIDNETIANSLLCIAMIEMNHYEVLSELITLLGGKPFLYNSNKYFYSTGTIGYMDNPYNDITLDKSVKSKIRLKIEKDILSEINAINAYNFIQKNINDKYINKIIEKIIEDEKFHLRLFNVLLEKYC